MAAKTNHSEIDSNPRWNPHFETLTLESNRGSDRTDHYATMTS